MKNMTTLSGLNNTASIKKGFTICCKNKVQLSLLLMELRDIRETKGKVKLIN